MGSYVLPKDPWWQDVVVYQVYPSSFKDSNSDGIGDIPGLISKLDYLQDLGINVVWLSPMYKSPQVDMGYDVSDYEDVHEPFGRLEDMDNLIKGLHHRGMKLILDLVVNHTSDQHSWFKESRSSKENPKSDWYIWRPPRYDSNGTRQPPNNWRANFGGSVWEWEEARQEYYLHYFALEQPDLNWECPAARKAIYDSAVRFWLDKGVDGFRIDTINKYSKPFDFTDAEIRDPSSPWQYADEMWRGGPRIHEFVKEMVREAFEPYGDIMTVGELPSITPASEIKRFTSAQEREINMVFHFDMVYTGMGTVRKYLPEPFTLPDVKESLAKWQRFVEGTDMWNTSFAENHDSARSISRFASDLPQYREESAKMLALLLTTLKGTLFVYQGQEIGMINIPRDWPVEEYKDLETQNFYNVMKEMTKNDPEKMKLAMDGIAYLARDHARTPMQWDDTANSGFSSCQGKPWMRVHDAYPEINVKEQQGRRGSPLEFWKHMIAFRKQHKELLVHGNFSEFDHDNLSLFTYTKTLDATRGHPIPDSKGSDNVTSKALVCLNFSETPQNIVIPDDCKDAKLELAISTRTKNSLGDHFDHSLGAYEGRLYWVTE